jgi:cytochrome P450
VYNLFFHPLRKFPGPFLHRASRLPWAIRHARGEQAFHTQKLHDQYGAVVRVGPNHLSFTNPQAWKDIYGNRTGGEMPKSKLFTRPVRGAQTSVLNADHDEHQQLRRALAFGFSDSSMRQQEATITKYVSLLVERLRQECDEGRRMMNMAAWYNWTTFDLVSDLVFGESFHCLETIDYHPWVTYIFKAIRFHAIIIALTYSGFGELVQLIHKAGGFLALNNIKEYTNSMLRSRLSTGKGRNDLFEGLAKRQQEWDLSFNKLSANATILLLAGSETTATTLCGITYLLLTNPKSLARLQQEIRSTFSSSDEITIASVGKLSYMLAALNETLRCYPPITAGMVRVVPPGGADIAGHFVSGGVSVLQSAKRTRTPTLTHCSF